MGHDPDESRRGLSRFFQQGPRAAPSRRCPRSRRWGSRRISRGQGGILCRKGRELAGKDSLGGAQMRAAWRSCGPVAAGKTFLKKTAPEKSKPIAIFCLRQIPVSYLATPRKSALAQTV